MSDGSSGSELSSGSLHGTEASSDGTDTPEPPVESYARGKSRRGRPSRRRGSVRGRGRGGRGRVGRGRGRGTSTFASTSQSSLSATEQITEYIQTQIDQMSEEAVRDVLQKVVEKHPIINLDIIQPTVGQGGFHPPEGNADLPWCTCGKCRDMPTAEERICCGQTPEMCLTLVPDFQVLILDEAVLTLARLYRQDVLVYPEDPDYNRAYRHTAYRQFILWQHGRLTAGERKVIPSCCVWKIRDKFPDPYGQYIGFLPTRLQ